MSSSRRDLRRGPSSNSASELGEATREIERLGQQTASIVQSAGEGICAVSADGAITTANQVAATIAGISRSNSPASL